jgi:drug/metabolite transporter (DMT)-like permease
MTAVIARSDNLRGSLLMTASMAGFAVEDVFVKATAKSMPLGQILLAVGLVGMLTFAAMARAKGEAMLPAAFFSRAMLIRSAFEVTGRLFYGLAITLTALSTTSAILQATPLLVVAAAAVIFGEKVGWQRWLAVILGFLGVLIILRPGVETLPHAPRRKVCQIGNLAPWVSPCWGWPGRPFWRKAAEPCCPALATLPFWPGPAYSASSATTP